MARVSWAGSEVIWVGKVGRMLTVVREVDGERILHVDDWTTVVGDRTEIHLKCGPLHRRLVIREPGREPVEFRYRLSWAAVLDPFIDFGWDRWRAEELDPGLVLVELLGGTDDW
ncbi:hypothetical protein ACFRMQ_24560 [Kitasatospora sp. NPDC056783]|uniref:hypothetical protein n=1 Tax=Kitasatospora sp. NPDC056783 TaxID=3345943 RepID=UPI0036B2439E